MPNLFCFCGYPNEYSLSSPPNFCGKCGKSLNQTIASRPKPRRQEINEDDLERRANKMSREDDEDDNSEALEGIDLDNIKISVSSEKGSNRFIVDQNFISSNKDGYVPSRQGFRGDIMEDFQRRSQTKEITGPNLED